MQCGVGDYTAHLARELGKRKDASVAVLTDIDAAHAPPDPYFDRFPVVKGWKITDIPAIVRTVRLWKPDVVHIQYPTQGYGERLFPFFLPILSKFLKVSVVQTWHEYYTGGSLIVLANASVSDAIVVVRPRYKSTMARLYRLLIRNKRMEYIPNASTIKTFLLSDEERSVIRSRYAVSSKKLVVYFGFVFRHKGVDLLFKIADPKIHHLVLICDLSPSDAYHQEILSATGQGEWSENVTVTGYLPGDDAGRLLAAADAVVFPFREGGGLWNTSLHGAVAQGTFVLTTSTEEKGYDPSNNIYYAQPGDVAEMREALNSYSGRRNKPAGEVGTWSSISESHVQLYRKMLGNG